MIPVNEPLLAPNAKVYLNECIDTGWISSEGPFVKRFEAAMAHTVNRNHAIAVANGTAALEVAVKALNIGAGDEVIMPSFTIISCAQAIINNGATPVLVDSDPITWNMDHTAIKSKITARTKAIMVVHIYGLPVDMDPVLAIAKEHNLKIIEDAAEMIGQTYKGKPCGSFGDISTFSFYPNKMVTTGEGGMLVTDDPDLAARCAYLRNLCFQPQQRFVHKELGWNYRMSNLQAALGLAQLEQLDQFVIKKRQIGLKYMELFQGTPGITLPKKETEFAQNIFWVFGLLLEETNTKSSAPNTPQELMKQLGKAGIGTRPFFWPMHQQPVFSDMGLFVNEHLPCSERLARRGFYLPSGMAITEEQIEKVVSVTKALLQ